MTVAPAASLAGILRRRPSGDPIAGPPVPGDDDPAIVIAWWSALKRGRAYPAPDDLDRAAIGAAWPAAVLLSGEGGGIARATRLGDRDDVSVCPKSS